MLNGLMCSPMTLPRDTADRVVSLLRLMLGCLAFAPMIVSAQPPGPTPGLWRYTITTDLAAVPADMRVNFPVVRFDVCLTEEDFASGRAFSIQPTPGSVNRCQTSDVRRDGSTVALRFACDDGKTLTGTAHGKVSARRFEIQLDNRYEPPVSGVSGTRQTMSVTYLGACKGP